MLLTTQTEKLEEFFGDKAAIEMVADAGFDSIDYSMFHMSRDNCILNTDEYKKYAKELKNIADQKGIGFTQAHAPFRFAFESTEQEYLKIAKDQVVRAIEVAGILGVEIIVVHPLQFRPYLTNKDYLKQINMKYYNELIPYCEEYGVKMACENMWQYNKKRECIIDSVCSQPAEFNDYIDSVNSEFLVACLDLGHCGLTNIEAQDCIRAMGSKRIKALHVHDNDYLGDDHTLPGFGEMNWDEITKALAEIDYTGNFTFEADNFLDSVGSDPKAVKAALTIMEVTGRNLISKIESYKKKR